MEQYKGIRVFDEILTKFSALYFRRTNTANRFIIHVVNIWSSCISTGFGERCFICYYYNRVAFGVFSRVSLPRSLISLVVKNVWLQLDLGLR